MLVWVGLTVLSWSGNIRFFCGDETRLGLKTLGGRKITADEMRNFFRPRTKMTELVSLLEQREQFLKRVDELEALFQAV
jgi:hypothetical protein